MRIFITNVSVDRPGRIAAHQCGIGVRGPAHLSNIYVSGLDGNQAGIEFEEGETYSVNGLGGHQSVLTNFHVYATGGSALGVYSVARNVHISNGYVEGGRGGVHIHAERNKVVNVTAVGCSNAAIYLAPGARECSILGCTVLGSREGSAQGIRIQSTNCAVSASTITDCASAGIYLADSADGTRIDNCYLSANNPNLNLTTSTNNHFHGITGFKTEAELVTGGILLDRSGVQTVSVQHGLIATPALHECHATLLMDRDVQDFALGWVRVRSVDASRVVVEVNVTQASRTRGAQAKVAIRIRTLV